MLKLVEINELSETELINQINKSRKELVDLRMKFSSRQLEDPSQIRKKRKEIARLLTVETQKIKNGDLSNVKVEPVKKNKKEDKKKEEMKQEVEKQGKKEIKSKSETKEKAVKEKKSLIKGIIGKKSKKEVK